MQSLDDTYYLIAVEDSTTGRVVACGSLIKERKVNGGDDGDDWQFIHSAAAYGHIEDIAVHSSMQGKRIGIAVINGLVEIGRRLGLYKIVLGM